MTCRDWEERIALDADDDPGAERHLAECAACRGKAAAWQRDLDLLKEAHQEPIAPAHYAAVRARVLAKLHDQRQPLWRRIWVSGLAAAALVALALLFPKPVQTPGRPALWGRLQPGPEGAPEFTPPGPAREGKLARRLKPAPHIRRAIRKPAPVQHEPLVVKLLTDDPNVIIYWITDRKGE